MIRFSLAIAIVCGFVACGQKDRVGRFISESDTTFSKDIRDISAKINATPDKPDLYYSRGNLFLNKDKFADAVMDMETAVNLDSNNAVYHLALGETILKLDSADPRKARLHLERAVALKSDFHDAELALAKFYLARQEYAKAEKLFVKLSKVPEFSSRSYVFLGLAKKEQKDTAQALQYFDRAQNADPENYDAAMQVALIKAAQNDPLAEKYFNKAIAIDETKDEAFYGRGLLMQKKGQYKEALANYDMVRTLNPSHVLCLYNSAVIYNLQKDFERAEEMCNKALDLNPDFANALALRGYTFEQRGNRASAIQDYKRTLELDPQNPFAIEGLKVLGD